MNNANLIDIALREIKDKAWGVTKQFLEVHELIYNESKPVISLFHKDDFSGDVVIYFAVRDEPFFFRISVSKGEEPEIKWIDTEANTSIFLRCDSDELGSVEILKMTNLISYKVRDKGDHRGNPKLNAQWKSTTVFFEPNPGPGSFEDKLSKLLSYLETDKKGVSDLVSRAKGYIQCVIEFHNGNTMLGGPHLTLLDLKRIVDLDLEIDFDLYATGNFFKE